MMSRRDPSRDAGIVLVQVLGIVAIASAIAVILLALQDDAIGYSQRIEDIERARNLARGGEASIVTAFRQDGALNDGIDHYGDAWAVRAQSPLQLENASFTLTVTDAQSKYNINRLASGNLGDKAIVDRIISNAGMDTDISNLLFTGMVISGPIKDMGDLRDAGLSSQDIEALSVYMTALPTPTSVNLNTADAGLLAAIINNPGSVARIVSLRNRNGYVTPDMLRDAGLVQPAGTGFETNHIDVRAKVSVGAARISMRSRLMRRKSKKSVEVYTSKRRYVAD